MTVAERLHGKDAPLAGEEPMVEEFRTPKSGRAFMYVRPATSDHNNAFSCLTEDEYGLRDVDLGEGVALDIGAHIGGVTIALALDNPRARVIAVECLSANVDLLTANAERNGVADRVTILHAAACRPGTKTATVEWNFDADEAGQHHRFIANAQGFDRSGSARETVKGVDLAALVKMAGGEIAFMKIDCELCEYDLLDTPAVKSVRQIVGEYHGGFERLADLLRATHDVRQTGGIETLGAFTAVRL